MKATTAPPETTEEVQQPTTWIARVLGDTLAAMKGQS